MYSRATLTQNNLKESKIWVALCWIFDSPLSVTAGSQFFLYLLSTFNSTPQKFDKVEIIFMNVYWDYHRCARQRNGQLPGSRAFWNRSADRGGEGPSPPYSGEKSQLKPSRDGETEKRRRKTHSGHDKGGSVANRLRRLLPLITDNLKEVTRSSGYVIVFFFSFRRINHLVLYYLHWSSVNTLLISCAEHYSKPSNEKNGSQKIALDCPFK